MKIQKNKTNFNFREVNESFRNFMRANRKLKGQSFNLQLGKAVEAGAMSYTEMLLYRDKFTAKPSRSQLSPTLNKLVRVANRPEKTTHSFPERNKLCFENR